MNCATCGKPAKFIGNDFKPECDECFRNGPYRFFPKVEPNVQDWVPTPKRDSNKYQAIAMRNGCMRALGLRLFLCVTKKS